MTRYLAASAARARPTLIGVSLLTFLFLRLVPGDAIAARLGTCTALTPSSSPSCARTSGSTAAAAPVLGWLASLLRGDAGYSMRTGQPVVAEIAGRLPGDPRACRSPPLLVALLIGLPLGILSALRPNSALDLAARGFGLLGLSLPNFWLGTLYRALLARYLRWMPNTGGYVGFTADPWANLRFLLFPALTLGVAMAAVVMRTTRSAMLDVLGADYVRTAHAKGLAASAVVGRHALRNGLIVVVTILGVQVGLSPGRRGRRGGDLLGPGARAHAADRDQPARLRAGPGTVLVVALLFVATNTLVDLLYGWLDPRISLG